MTIAADLLIFARMDVLTAEQRKKNMQANKSVGTKSEVLLAKALWHNGYRYIKNDKTILGKPDISFRKFKIAIFCDGEFWHGKDWINKKNKITVNQTYWHRKIEKNIQRDIVINKSLTENGWIVVRLWDKEIKSNLSMCLKKIEQIILQRKNEKI